MMKFKPVAGCVIRVGLVGGYSVRFPAKNAIPHVGSIELLFGLIFDEFKAKCRRVQQIKPETDRVCQ